MKKYTECENCGSIWSIGTEEYDWQQCSSCGWRPGMPIDDEPDFNSVEDDDWEDERNDPNDSRNL